MRTLLTGSIQIYWLGIWFQI